MTWRLSNVVHKNICTFLQVYVGVGMKYDVGDMDREI